MLPLTPDSIRITQNGRSLNKKYLNNYDCISYGAPNYARFFTNIAYNLPFYLIGKLFHHASLCSSARLVLSTASGENACEGSAMMGSKSLMCITLATEVSKSLGRDLLLL